MRKKLKDPTFITLLFSLLVLSACTRPATTPPPEGEASDPSIQQTAEAGAAAVAQLTAEAEARLAREAEVAGTLTAIAEAQPTVPPTTAEPVSRFSDIDVTYYVYNELVWACDRGLIEPCGPAPTATEVAQPTPESSLAPEEDKEDTQAEAEEVAPAKVKINPERQMIWGELYVSADRYFHQSASFVPPAYTNTNYKDKGISSTVAAAAEDLGRNRAMPRFFYCGWPSTQFICPDRPATRVHGAIMVEVLAHLGELIYDPNPGKYTGSWLGWDPLPRQSELPYPDCAFSYGLTEEEAHACVAIGVDEIYLQRGASSDFGPNEPLTVAMWAEWLYNAYHNPDIGPPKSVPVIAPSSP